MQTASPAAADGWTLARSTGARSCATAWRPIEILKTYFKILVHGVVLEVSCTPWHELRNLAFRRAKSVRLQSHDLL